MADSVSNVINLQLYREQKRARDYLRAPVYYLDAFHFVIEHPSPQYGLGQCEVYTGLVEDVSFDFSCFTKT